MKKCAWMLLVFFSLPGWLKAQSADDQFVVIYGLIQEAAAYNKSGQGYTARNKYLQAEKALRNLQGAYPDWHRDLVQWRLKDVAKKLAPLQPFAPKAETADPVAMPATTTPQIQPIRSSDPPPVTPVPQYQLRQLQHETARLTADNQLLQAKLREALSAKPGVAPVAELAEAQSIIAKLRIEMARLTAATPNAPTAVQTESSNPDSVRVLSNALAESRRQNQELQDQLAMAKSSSSAADRVKGLEDERDAAFNQLESKERELQHLISDNQTAKERILQLAAQRRTEDIDLQAATSKNSFKETIKLLEEQRKELQTRLNLVNKTLYDKDRQIKLAHIDQLNQQVKLLNARLQAYTQKTPFSAEELVLMAPADPPLASAPSSNRILRNVPASAKTLLDAAKTAFQAQRYGEAESHFQQLLRLDSENTYTLHELAWTKVDADSLLLLGHHYYLQYKIELAFDALSLSAQIDPDNSETQNLLGVVLANKGNRNAAEAALRKAILLNPDHGNAHNNLAVVYGDREPPMEELARWHRQKAENLRMR